MFSVYKWRGSYISWGRTAVCLAICALSLSSSTLVLAGASLHVLFLPFLGASVSDIIIEQLTASYIQVPPCQKWWMSDNLTLQMHGHETHTKNTQAVFVLCIMHQKWTENRWTEILAFLVMSCCNWADLLASFVFFSIFNSFYDPDRLASINCMWKLICHFCATYSHINILLLSPHYNGQTCKNI